jgi:hypothetical protein
MPFPKRCASRFAPVNASWLYWIAVEQAKQHPQQLVVNQHVGVRSSLGTVYYLFLPSASVQWEIHPAALRLRRVHGLAGPRGCGKPGGADTEPVVFFVFDAWGQRCSAEGSPTEE